MTGELPIDEIAIRGHVELIHQLAASLAGKGKLIVAAFGEDPVTGKELFPDVWHCRIGDVENTIARIKASAKPNYNVYVPLAMFRQDLPKGKKGSENDIVAVLGWVGDFDDPRAHEWASRLPVEPSLVIESSHGRFQPFLLYDKPVEQGLAKRAAEYLRKRAGCDAGSMDTSHVWRVPGTWNWPNTVKLAPGRSPDPQSVTVAQKWDGRLYELAELVPAEVLTAPAKAKPARPNGATGDEAPLAPAEIEALIATLPQDLRDLLNDQTPQYRSTALYRIVRQLTGLGLDAHKIEAVLEARPNGPFSKYADRDDLADDIARIRGKAHEPPPPKPDDLLSPRNTKTPIADEEPEPQQGNGRDRSTEEGSVSPKVGDDGGGGELPPPGDGTGPEDDDELEPNDPQAEFECKLEECCRSGDLNDSDPGHPPRSARPGLAAGRVRRGIAAERARRSDARAPDPPR
jgi:hypothetical protein